MRFNLAAGVKYVTRVLNPDLEIPDSSGGKGSTAPPRSATRTSSSSSPSSPPSSASSSPPAAAVAAAPSVPFSHNGTKHSSRRSSLSVRRFNRKSALVRTQQAPPLPQPQHPLSKSTLEPKTALPATFQRDCSATTTQDPTLQSYPPPISSTRRARASTATITPGRSTCYSKLNSAVTAATATATTPSPPTIAPYLELPNLTSSSHTSGGPPAAVPQEGTATCLCGKVHLAFPTTAPGLVASFVCYCSDCTKGGAEAGVVVKDDFLTHVRGTSNLSSFSQPVSTPSIHSSTTFFCQTCGSTMYRVGTAFPGCVIVRMGTVDDARLVEGRLRPTRELCVQQRPTWGGWGPWKRDEDGD